MENSDTRPVPTTSVPIAWNVLLDSFARRALDILAAGFGLLLLAPFFAVIAFAIKRDTPGPVFYRGPRAGRGGRPFGILKFRTMYERPECYQGPAVTAAGDARVTPFGRWLRNTKLNELPQLWNVLVGQMALVGPRPEDPEIAAGWPEPVREELLAVRPGVTSPATVLFRDEERMLHAGSLMDDYLRAILPDKLRIDTLYVRRRNFLTDLDVIFMTLVALLPRLREEQIPETFLYWGPLSRFVSRFLNWFVMDLLAAFAAVSLAGIIWRLDAPLNLGPGLALGFAIVIAVFFSLVNALLGLNRVQWRRAPAFEAITLAFSTGVATVFLVAAKELVLDARLPKPGLPSGMLLVGGLLAFIGFAAMRYRSRLLSGLANAWLSKRRENPAIGERVLLVGAGDNSQFATWLLTRSNLAGAFAIVGIADDDPRKQGLYYDGYPVLGSTRDIPALVERHGIGLVLFTISNIDPVERGRILRTCQASHTRLVILPDVMDSLAASFKVGVPAAA